jgi:hypothetical protein
MQLNPSLQPPDYTPKDYELTETLIEAVKLRRMLGPETPMHLVRHQGDKSWRVQIGIPKGGARYAD